MKMLARVELGDSISQELCLTITEIIAVARLTRIDCRSAPAREGVGTVAAGLLTHRAMSGAGLLA
jgi:riboflavin synthase alpha subunit